MSEPTPPKPPDKPPMLDYRPLQDRPLVAISQVVGGLRPDDTHPSHPVLRVWRSGGGR